METIDFREKVTFRKATESKTRRGDSLRCVLGKNVGRHIEGTGSGGPGKGLEDFQQMKTGLSNKVARGNKGQVSGSWNHFFKKRR